MTGTAANTREQDDTECTEEQDIEEDFTISAHVAYKIDVIKENCLDCVSCFDISPDSSYLAVGTLQGQVRLYEVSSGLRLMNSASHSEAVSVVKWSPDGTCVAASTARGPVRVWRMATGAVRVLGGRQDVAWSPDSSKLCSGYQDYACGIWNVFTGVLERRITCRTFDYRLLHWGKDGTLLAGGRHMKKDDVLGLKGNEGSIRETLWKEGSGMFQNILCRGYRIHCRYDLWYDQPLAWSPDAKCIAMSNRRTDEFSVLQIAMTHTEVERKRRVPGRNSKVTAAAWSPDSRFLVFSSHDRTVIVWDCVKWLEVCSFTEEVYVAHAVAWSPCGGSVLYECGKQLKIHSVILPQ